MKIRIPIAAPSRRSTHDAAHLLLVAAVLCTWPGSDVARAEQAAPAPSRTIALETPDGAEPLGAVERVVREKARELSSSTYTEPPAASLDWLPDSYDTYRQVRFDPARARWRSDEGGFEVHLLPAGWLFKQAVKVWLVEGGEIAPAEARWTDFIDGREQPPPTPATDHGTSVPTVPLSGFRINWPLNETAKSDEVIVFQGASYFRALARGQRYGLSARGLAIGTASAGGEEFPMFREFWIERPAKDALEIVIHALLDSPSTTGAYRFVVRPGETTRVDVTATLFPRRRIEEIGLAPLTSMFMLGPADRRRIDDFRPEVHDSDGLAILNGQGEHLWRPLKNPHRLQVSSFVDGDNNGFGLAQRQRDFAQYQDLEAHYELRPSVWVEPLSEFGSGQVMLVEIPTELEIHDNIVAFWRPSEPLLPGATYEVRYRLHWRAHVPAHAKTLAVQATRAGRSHFAKGNEPTYLFVIDYAPHEAPAAMAAANAASEGAKAIVSASEGAVDNVVVRDNPARGGLRVSFEFRPKGAEQADLRLDLSGAGDLLAESWLYRWTAAR